MYSLVSWYIKAGWLIYQLTCACTCLGLNILTYTLDSLLDCDMMFVMISGCQKNRLSMKIAKKTFTCMVFRCQVFKWLSGIQIPTVQIKV